MKQGAVPLSHSRLADRGGLVTRFHHESSRAASPATSLPQTLLARAHASIPRLPR